ncbi:MAG: carboxypeptidase-like regulatory domain-containing protein [Gemmatimonadota bacterium]|jgi:hypothetical protein
MRLFVKEVLRGGFSELLILRSYELRPDDSPLIFRDRLSAQGFLHRFLRDESSRNTLRKALLREGFVPNPSQLDDQGVIREFAGLLVSKRLSLVALDRPVPEEGGGAPPGASSRRDTADSAERDSQPEEGDPAERGRRPEEEDSGERSPRRPAVFPKASTPRNWIKLLLVDDETEEPIPGVKIRVRLSSGETGEPTTDRRGTIYIDDVPPGTIDILEILDDEGLEVVEVD